MPDEKGAGHRYPKQPTKPFFPAFASDHLSSEAGAEFQLLYAVRSLKP
jgi:hypothetical protein